LRTNETISKTEGVKNKGEGNRTRERERNTIAEREAKEETVKGAQKICFGKKQSWFKLHRTVLF